MRYKSNLSTLFVFYLECGLKMRYDQWRAKRFTLAPSSVSVGVRNESLSASVDSDTAGTPAAAVTAVTMKRELRGARGRVNCSFETPEIECCIVYFQ